MREWTISAAGATPAAASSLAARAYPPLRRRESPRRTYLLAGSDQATLAACAQTALAAGHRVVLLPGQLHAGAPAGTFLNAAGGTVSHAQRPGGQVRGGWDLAMFSSGSTTGTPRGYGFTAAQLVLVTSWYQRIYQLTPDSVIVTSLPAGYNFTFVAGVMLAAALGARLHFSRSAACVFRDAARLARACDRVVVLANPVVLDQAPLSRPVPRNILADSGGAPLSTTAVEAYRAAGLDVREGYGLTETASLTHFDTDAGPGALGTAGTAMPGVTAAASAGKPVLSITSPATGIPLNPAEPVPGTALITTDLGLLNAQGCLRLLGRADDEQISGLWPHDTLDALGPLLGCRCALVRQRDRQAHIRLLNPASGELVTALRSKTAGLLDLPLASIAVTFQGPAPLLHSAKLTRPA